jgi:hypothetical protein
MQDRQPTSGFMPCTYSSSANLHAHALLTKPAHCLTKDAVTASTTVM